MPQTCAVRVTVNGVVHERDVEPRRLLADFIRHDLHLTGTHLGCEHGVCGACTVMVDGVSVRSCLILAPPGRWRRNHDGGRAGARSGTTLALASGLSGRACVAVRILHLECS